MIILEWGLDWFLDWTMFVQESWICLRGSQNCLLGVYCYLTVVGENPDHVCWGVKTKQEFWGRSGPAQSSLRDITAYR